ncbi:60S ribosomal protein L17-2-like protein [Tanacetum coccineum]|uniref:60S ribosomal protein L17-2-like protein n=1 Tax=Tanacetum coccineum TaxID=301880 RepID=A0ABQ5E5S1_9ASTR
MDKDVGLICMLNLFLIFKNADIDVEVKGWMWMLFTSFTSRLTKHNNKDASLLVLTEELINTKETAQALRGMALIKAKRYLEEVHAHKQAILFTHLSLGIDVLAGQEKNRRINGQERWPDMMPLIKAKGYLEDVLAHKQAILFTRLCHGVRRTSWKRKESPFKWTRTLALYVVVTLLDDPVVEANHMFNVVNIRETAHALRGMALIMAKRYLEDVLAHKQAIFFTRLCQAKNRHLNGQGRWPDMYAKFILDSQECRYRR